MRTEGAHWSAVTGVSPYRSEPLDRDEGSRGRRIAFAAALAGIVAALWLLMTWTVHVHELLVGLGAVVFSTWFLTGIFCEELRRYRFRAADVLSCWRLPWYVLGSTGEILAVLLRDLTGKEAAASLYRVCGFKTAKEEPRMLARRALAIAYTSVAPNFIVLGVDYNQSRMLFHQIRRGPIPKMTQELGAQVSHDPARHLAPPVGWR